MNAEVIPFVFFLKMLKNKFYYLITTRDLILFLQLDVLGEGRGRFFTFKTWATYTLIFKRNERLSASFCLSIYLYRQIDMYISSVQSLSRVRLCDPMDSSMPGLPVHHQLLEFTQSHVHWVGDAIQPSHPLSTPYSPTFSLSQHQGLFQWVSSSHQVAKVLEFQLQHQSFQWIFKTDFL